MRTLQDFKEELNDHDPVDLLDLLEITSPDIVDAFDYKVEDVYNQLSDDDLT